MNLSFAYGQIFLSLEKFKPITMKNLLTSILACLVIGNTFAQLETRTFTWDETERQYLEYIPTGYTGEEAVPVVFGLHGLGDNMNNFYSIGMNYIADTANFILIIPQAEEYTYFTQTFTAWNSGASLYGITPNADVDDTGFLMAVLDSLINNYNVDTESVYFFGFSMGGYMCNRLAAEVGERINAIASVSGTMGVNFDPQPDAETHVACLHFHGTADETVPYSENTSGMDAEEVVEFWRAHNNCEETAIQYNYPDTETDNLTFERYVYPDGDAQVAHIKVIGGAHEWYHSPNNDIDYGTEIWTFFKYRFSEEPVSSQVINQEEWDIYPNPVKNSLNIRASESQQAKLQIFNALGLEIANQTISGSTSFRMTDLPEGVYILKLQNEKGIYTRSVLKQ